MRQLTILIAAMALTGCASTSEWRTLRIDGSSEASLRESLTRLEQELPRAYHRRMLEIALADIWSTSAQRAGETDDGEGAAYTKEDYRAELHGLTYESVVALANQTGRSVSSLYYSRHQPSIAQPESRYGALPGPAPAFHDNGSPNHGTWRTGWPAGSIGSGETVVTRPESR